MRQALQTSVCQRTDHAGFVPSQFTTGRQPPARHRHPVEDRAARYGVPREGWETLLISSVAAPKRGRGRGASPVLGNILASRPSILICTLQLRFRARYLTKTLILRPPSQPRGLDCGHSCAARSPISARSTTLSRTHLSSWCPPTD